MNLNEFAKEIHENAKAHGWWDEPRPFDELCALMISELAEALEEARAGRPMEYRVCDVDGEPCDHMRNCWHVGCPLEGSKPEGIAVEMADCAIRILDYLGYKGYPIDEEKLRMGRDTETYKCLPYAFMKVCMHIVEAHENEDIGMDEVHEVWSLEHALSIILNWFEANDLDFEAIARRKHEYNETRERLHGKLF